MKLSSALPSVQVNLKVIRHLESDPGRRRALIGNELVPLAGMKFDPSAFRALVAQFGRGV